MGGTTLTPWLLGPQLLQLKAELDAGVALSEQALACGSAARAVDGSDAGGGSGGSAAGRCADSAVAAGCLAASHAAEPRAGGAAEPGDGGDRAAARGAAGRKRTRAPPALPGSWPDAEAAGAGNGPCAAGRERGAAGGGGGGTNNARIHPRSRYAEHEPDFAALAARFPALRPFVAGAPCGRGRIDFTDSAAVRCTVVSSHTYRRAWRSYAWRRLAAWAGQRAWLRQR